MQISYSKYSVWLHWLMFVLIAATYASIELRVIFEKGTTEREAIKNIHYIIGMSIFVLVWLRLFIRLITPTPHREYHGRWQKLASKMMFFALYCFMIAQPLLGWVLINLEGVQIQLFIAKLPNLLAENEHLAESVEEIHETTGKIGYVLISVHTIAAILHHYYWKDKTLKRMSFSRN